MAGAHGVAGGLPGGLFRDAHEMAAAGRFMVGQQGVRRPQHLAAGRAHPQAQVDIAEIDRETGGVETADSVEHLPPHDQAGAGHRRHLADVIKPPHIAALVGANTGQAVAGDIAADQMQAGVLHRLVGVEQHGADRANRRPNGEGDHLGQPVGAQGLAIIVEETEDVAGRVPRRVIVKGGVIERPGGVAQAQARARRQPREQGVAGRLAAIVVDQDDLEIRIGGVVQHRV